MIIRNLTYVFTIYITDFWQFFRKSVANIRIIPETCLTLKNVESKPTFRNGENRRFRIVRVAGTRHEAQKGFATKIIGRKMHDC